MREKISSSPLGRGVVGQAGIISLLAEQIDSKMISSAYLFSGGKDLGKYALAKNFAGVLVCAEGGLSRCGMCRQCKLFQRNAFPDYFEIDVLDAKMDITIDQIRELKQAMQYKSHYHGYKVAVIRNAELLNPAAGSALLKILEEPYPKNIFILLHNATRPMLPTIVSRCQTFVFTPPPRKEIERWLQKNGAAQELAYEFSLLSLNKPSLAKTYLNDVVCYKERISSLQGAIETIVSGTFMQSIITAEKAWSYEHEQALSTLEEYLFAIRLLLRAKLGCQHGMLASMKKTHIEHFIQTQTAQFFLKQLEIVRTAISNLEWNVPSGLIIDNATFSLIP